MDANCWTKTKYSRKGLSRGENRVVLKSAPYNGAEGRILSRTKNGWLRVEITLSGPSFTARAVVKVRNNPFYLTKPFVYKVFGTAGRSPWGGRNQVSQAWWVPLTGVSIKEPETKDDVILTRLKALAIPSTQETQCFKCCGRGHWSSECPVPRVSDEEHFKNRTGRYSWGPQGEMGPRWGSSYTGD